MLPSRRSFAFRVRVLENVFFGGDQLTEERVNNARDASRDRHNAFERLEGVIPKVEGGGLACQQNHISGQKKKKKKKIAVYLQNT